MPVTPKFFLWFCLREVPRLCDKIMREKFRAVFLQYRLLKDTESLTIFVTDSELLLQFLPRTDKKVHSAGSDRLEKAIRVAEAVEVEKFLHQTRHHLALGAAQVVLQLRLDRNFLKIQPFRQPQFHNS